MDIDVGTGIVLLCGIGTFLMRWLPMWTASDRTPQTGFVGRLSDSIGPAAVASLLVAMIWPLLRTFTDVSQGLSVLGGLFATWGVKRVGGGLATPALMGAIVYGVLQSGF